MARKKIPILVKEHELIPKHVKLDPKQRAALLKGLKITTRELPKISKLDNGIATLEPEEGDVIKIIRKSPTSGETIFYRVVLDV